ncbi:MBL fold metallo-hydrolase [Massilia phyllosphaerae]|uniref:MBL fold metallo-hydrolase n=1 Tax=Massilia phyllosphaerae TaxID=3106034 RepID=UPI002B1CBE34|nr:MBL fold metallo-hydrolase [Massilia sp. SGZ-792]
MLHHRLLGRAAMSAALVCSLSICIGAHAQQAPAPAATAATQTLTLPAGSAAPAVAEGSVQFIGTATVLIRYQGFTILTDPNFLHKGDHVHLGYGLTSERLTNPAIDLDQLPPIDLVVLSHMHEDHFDKLVQEKLAKDTPIVSTPEAAEALKQLGFTRTFGLSKWGKLEVEKGNARLRITAAPGRHGKLGMQALLPTVMGSVLDFGPDTAAPSYRMYISGDTLVYDDLQNIPQRFPGIDLALLHLGGTRILGVFKVTMDGKDGVQLMQIVQPRHAIPIHYNDYDVFKSPLADFAREVKEAGLEQKVTYLAHGQTYFFTPARR